MKGLVARAITRDVEALCEERLRAVALVSGVHMMKVVILKCEVQANCFHAQVIGSCSMIIMADHGMWTWLCSCFLRGWVGCFGFASSEAVHQAGVNFLSHTAILVSNTKNMLSYLKAQYKYSMSLCEDNLRSVTGPMQFHLLQGAGEDGMKIIIISPLSFTCLPLLLLPEVKLR